MGTTNTPSNNSGNYKKTYGTGKPKKKKPRKKK